SRSSVDAISGTEHYGARQLNTPTRLAAPRTALARGLASAIEWSALQLVWATTHDAMASLVVSGPHAGTSAENPRAEFISVVRSGTQPLITSACAVADALVSVASARVQVAAALAVHAASSAAVGNPPVSRSV